MRPERHKVLFLVPEQSGRLLRTTVAPGFPVVLSTKLHTLCAGCARAWAKREPPGPPADIVYVPCCECGQDYAYLADYFNGLTFPYCVVPTHPRTRLR